MEFLYEGIINLLEKYGEMLNPYLRLKLVVCLVLVRSKNLISPIKYLFIKNLILFFIKDP